MQNKIKFSGKEERLDLFLKQNYPDLSREFLKKMIEEEMVLVNNKFVKPSFKLKENDEISIIENKRESKLKIKDILVYEDKDILIINKPIGLLTHPTDLNWTFKKETLNLFEESVASLLYDYDENLHNLERLGIVHRLDRETSGLMLIAKNKNSQEILSKDFSDRNIKKLYLALVKGQIKEENFTINAPIGRPKGSKYNNVWIYGREAITLIKTLKSNKDFSYLEVSLKTGRTNQIRIHLSYIGHPVIGDEIYSKDKYERMMLHAFKLEFNHPLNNKKMKFEAKPDKLFSSILKKTIKL